MSAAAGVGLSGLGMLMSYNGAKAQGKANYLANIYNADVAEQNAKQATEQGAEEERRSRVESAKILGDARASYGASGVTMEGSPMEILAESARNAELDALTIKHGAELRATAFRNEAKMSRQAGMNAYQMGQYSAAANLLGGATRTLSMGSSALAGLMEDIRGSKKGKSKGES